MKKKKQKNLTQQLPIHTRNNIILKLLLPNQESHRTEATNLIDVNFLEQTISYLKQIKEKKRNKKGWYARSMLNKKLSGVEICWNAAISLATLRNEYKTTVKDTVHKIANQRYKDTIKLIESMVDDFEDVSLNLTIGTGSSKISLNHTDVVMIINALATRKAGITGGVWSTVGKRVEKPLMITLCKLLDVPEEYYDLKRAKFERRSEVREIDFHLFPDEKTKHKCEVKLSGIKNTESADVVWARDTKVLVSDFLSDVQKKLLPGEGRLWVSMDDGNAVKQFAHVLTELDIPYTPFNGDLASKLNKIFKTID